MAVSLAGPEVAVAKSRETAADSAGHSIVAVIVAVLPPLIFLFEEPHDVLPVYCIFLMVRLRKEEENAMRGKLGFR